jgi:arylsulfatase A-like enzyme
MNRILQSRWLPFAGAAVLLVALAWQFVRVEVPSRPVRGIEALRELRERDDLNVVFILIDTLRADRTSAYGYSRATTPTFVDLASSAVRFAHVTAQSSWTKTSMASLWTGTYPARNGVLRYPHAMAEAQTMPAEILKQAGFKTIGLYRNGWIASNFGFAQGFDVYATPARRKAPEPTRANPSGGTLAGTDFDITESAVEFARAEQGARLFLYLHYMDVHQYVFDEKSSLFGTSFSDSYDNAVHWVDRNVNVVLRGLDEAGLLEKTVVVIASDHGEGFREHGIEGHGRQLYREAVETPLLLVLPFRLDREVVVKEPVANVDVWPTLLDLLGLPPLPDAQGRSLLPLIEAAYRDEPASVPERTGISHIDQTWGRMETAPSPLVKLSRGDWRFYLAPDGTPPRVELYDVASDPGERSNVAGTHPDVASSFAEEARSYLKEGADVHPPEREIDEMRLHQLRALGYLVQ